MMLLLLTVQLSCVEVQAPAEKSSPMHPEMRVLILAHLAQHSPLTHAFLLEKIDIALLQRDWLTRSWAYFSLWAGPTLGPFPGLNSEELGDLVDGKRFIERQSFVNSAIR